MVQSGSYEIGVLNYKVWGNELTAGKIDTNKVRIIWKTPAYPDYNWSIRPDVEKTYGKGFIQKVKDALLKMKNRELLDSFPRRRFISAENSMYNPILETGIKIGLIDN